jgi:CheY-like chemotaxis protein
MKVLIVDDEAISRRLLQNYLEKWGYQVVVAENGGRAWQLFQNGDFRMVISDWLMPEMDGLELVRRIRAHNSPGYVYAILVTVRAQKEDLVEAMEAGADDFISKPFDRDELRVRLREGERIIQLQQTLADQNQRLAQAEQVISDCQSNGTSPTAAGLASKLSEPLANLRQCMALLQTAVPRLASVDNELRQTRSALIPSAPDLAKSLDPIAAECTLSRETITRSLASWQNATNICDRSTNYCGRSFPSWSRAPEGSAPRDEARRAKEVNTTTTVPTLTGNC